ncbi:LysE family translocator [Acinetobacter sp. WU_MDCI_Axc73]|nr:LysE family translocator [Acinetobacter sp. WU_MDCI_Axc73]
MTLFIFIAFTHFIALLSPGPDFFLILTTLLRSGKRAAQMVCLAIAAGNGLILIGVFGGWSLLGKMDASVLHYLSWFGAAYLLYLSVLCFRCAKVDLLPQAQDQECKQSNDSAYKYAMLGLQSSLLNPKNILFYSSLTILVAEKFNVIQKVSISIWMVALVLVWNLFLVQFLAQATWMRLLSRNAKWLYYLSGSCFLLFAVLLISV